VVTILVVGWIVRLADSYIGPSSSFGKFLVTIFGTGSPFPGYVAGYVVVVLLIILLGFLVTRATISRIRNSIDLMFAGIPLVGKIYTAVVQVVDLLDAKNGKAGMERFGGVVQIPLGELKVLALLTSGERYVTSDGVENILVFVPNAPVPATGFNLLVPADQVCRLDMPVEDLAKLLMSLGILGPQVLRIPLENTCKPELDDERQSA
jgi:uncharacterized membrane protein